MAGKTHEIAFKIAGQLAGSFSAAFKNAGKSVADLQAATGNMLRTASNTSAIIKQSDAVEKSRKAYEAARAKTLELAAAMKAAKQPTQEQIAAFNKLEKEVKDTKASYIQNKQKLNELRDATGIAETNIYKLCHAFNKQQAAADRAKNALASYNKTQEKIAGVNTKIDGVKSGMASNAGAIAGVIGAGAATFGLPIKKAMAYEDAMADVKKVVDFDSASLKQFNEDIGVMATQIAMSTPELLQISAAWGATGAKAKDMKQLTEMTAKAAVAMDMSAESAGQMMASWKGGMGLSVNETERLANLTNELSNNFNASAGAVGEFLVRAGPAGKVAGANAEQLASLGAALINAGNTAEIAATGAKAVFDVLGKGGSLSGAAADAFSQLGLNPRELQSLMKNKEKGGAQAVLLKVLESLSGQDEDIQNQLLTDAFGVTGKNALAPLISNIEDYKTAIKIAGDETAKTTSLKKEFEARNATTSNALVLVSNAFSAVMRAIGEPLLGPIREFSNRIVQLTPAITAFIKENQNLILKVLKVAAIFGAVVIAANGLMLALRAVVLPVMYAYKAFLMLKSAFALLKVKMALLNGTMLASPWFWVIAAIAALVAAGVLLYKNFDVVKEKVESLWLAFYNRFPNIATVVGAVISTIITVAKGLWVAIKMVFYSIWEVIKGVIDHIITKFTGWLDVVEATIGFFATLFSADSTWGDVWDSFKNVVEMNIKSTINNITSFVNIGIGAINGLIKGLNGIELPKWMGGGSINIPTIPKIPQMAKGGVVTRSTIANIGEAGPEAVIPLRKLDNMVGGGGFTFAPVINVSGGGDVYNDVKKALNESKAELRREMDRYFADKRRLSYA